MQGSAVILPLGIQCGASDYLDFFYIRLIYYNEDNQQERVYEYSKLCMLYFPGAILLNVMLHLSFSWWRMAWSYWPINPGDAHPNWPSRGTGPAGYGTKLSLCLRSVQKYWQFNTNLCPANLTSQVYSAPGGDIVDRQITYINRHKKNICHHNRGKLLIDGRFLWHLCVVRYVHVDYHFADHYRC